MGDIFRKFSMISMPLLLAGGSFGLSLEDAEAKGTSSRSAQTPKTTPKKARPSATPARRSPATTVRQAAKPKPALDAKPKEDCNVSDIRDRQRVAYFTNLNTGEVVFGAEDADKKFFQASVTKLATIYVALNLIQEGKLSLDQEIPIQRSGFTNTRGHVERDLQFPASIVSMKLKDLILLARMRSSNIAAHNIALAIERADGNGRNFAEITQRYVSDIGMTSTYSDDASSGTGFPTRRAISVQSTSARNEALLLQGLSRFPDDLAWMNVTKATLEAKTADGKAKKIDIETKIQSQLRNNPNYLPSTIIKTGYGCQTGHAESGIVNINGANIAFTLSGYAKAIDRSATRHRILDRIEREIAEGKIAVGTMPDLQSEMGIETAEEKPLIITSEKQPEQTISSLDIPNPFKSRTSISFALAVGLIGCSMVRMKWQEKSGNKGNQKPAFAPINAQNQQLNIV